MRYLAHSFRDQFDLPGVPVRMVMRKGRNPYVDK
jgi:GTP-binding protein